jgi:hypothetical protein
MVAKLRKKPLSLPVQQGHLRRLFPGSRTRISLNCLRWIGYITPSPLSQSYRLQMTYKIGKRPKVFVISPKLQLPEFLYEVHVFKDGSLCLYYMDEWDSQTVLAETVVPWISEWLLHYEIWRTTETWRGGGIHPHTTQ